MLMHAFRRFFISFLVTGNLFALFSFNFAYASAVRGAAHDGWADIVIGQPDFTEVTPNKTVSNRLFMPHGIIVDRTNPSENKMYVYDAGNSRILGYDLNTCLASLTDPLNCTPDLVIGQPNFTTSACNGDSGFQDYPDLTPASASTLCGVSQREKSILESEAGSSMAVDSVGNLYITDILNNRVLKYISPFTTDTIADDVWGQDNFAEVLCNKGHAADETTFCFSEINATNGFSGVEIDSSGNMWVADHSNNRVLRFPESGGSISKSADLVLGQDTFTTSDSGSGLNELLAPAAVRVTSSGVVYVADRENNRILKYETPATGVAGVTFGSDFSQPTGIDFDDTEPGRLWITNSSHCTLELWDEGSETKVREVGVRDTCIFTNNTFGSLGVDSSGNIYFANGSGDFNNDVLTVDKAGPDDDYSHILYTPSIMGNEMDARSFAAGQGVAISNGQLIVEDRGRILFWNIPNGIDDLTNWKAADGVVVVSDFSSADFTCCLLMEVDQANHLYVAQSVSPQISVYTLPLTTGESPLTTLDFPYDVLGGGEVTQLVGGEQLTGLIPASDSSYLWITQREGHRVLRLRNPLGGSPLVDVVLGQNNITDDDCNQGGAETNTTLCYPGVLGIDKEGNFYIADNSNEGAGNHRIIMYESGTFPTDNSSVIFATEPTKIFPDLAPSSIAFDSQNRMVTGFDVNFGDGPNPNGGWFAGAFLDPVGSSDEPDFYLNDYNSIATGAMFDSEDNLFISDASRSRVLVYKTPFPDTSSDTTPPTKPGKPTSSSEATDKTPRWTWGLSTDNESVDHYKIQWCKDIDFDGCSANNINKDNNGFTHEKNLSDGTWYARVRAFDTANNGSQWSSIGKFTVSTSKKISSVVVKPRINTATNILSSLPKFEPRVEVLNLPSQQPVFSFPIGTAPEVPETTIAATPETPQNPSDNKAAIIILILIICLVIIVLIKVIKESLKKSKV